MPHLLTFLVYQLHILICIFFINDTATTDIYTLSLHDALPIFSLVAVGGKRTSARVNIVPCSGTKKRGTECLLLRRSEERFSRNAETDLVCRLLLEKKKNTTMHTDQKRDSFIILYHVCTS